MRITLLLAILICPQCLVAAQMVSLSTPLQSNGASFFERTGISWGLDIPGSSRVVGLLPNGQRTPDGSIPIRFGGQNAVLPPFGGFDPGAESTLGVAWRHGGGGGFFNLALAQGNTRTSSVVSPSLTLTDGYPGFIFDGQLQPFVTGFVPVVGNNALAPAPPQIISPVRSRIARLQSGESSHRSDVPRSTSHDPASIPRVFVPSSAERGDRSLREIRAAQSRGGDAAADASGFRQLVRQAKQAERGGKLFAARQLLRQAVKKSPSEHRDAISAELARLNRTIDAKRRR